MEVSIFFRALVDKNDEKDNKEMEEAENVEVTT